MPRRSQHVGADSAGVLARQNRQIADGIRSLAKAIDGGAPGLAEMRFEADDGLLDTITRVLEAVVAPDRSPARVASDTLEAIRRFRDTVRRTLLKARRDHSTLHHSFDSKAPSCDPEASRCTSLKRVLRLHAAFVRELGRGYSRLGKRPRRSIAVELSRLLGRDPYDYPEAARLIRAVGLTFEQMAVIRLAAVQGRLVFSGSAAVLTAALDEEQVFRESRALAKAAERSRG